MENKPECLRCGQSMRCVGREQLQLGKTGWLLGDLPNLLAGAMEVDIYVCPECRKLEFYLAEDETEEETDSEEMPQKRCPKCGKQHDFDYPRCPFCKFDYYTRDDRAED